MDSSPNPDLEEVKTGATPDHNREPPKRKRVVKTKALRKNTTDPAMEAYNNKSPTKEINSAVPALGQKTSRLSSPDKD